MQKMELLKKNNAYSLIIDEEDRKEPPPVPEFKEDPDADKKNKRKQVRNSGRGKSDRGREEKY
jgi:hypothetical protein